MPAIKINIAVIIDIPLQQVFEDIMGKAGIRKILRDIRVDHDDLWAIGHEEHANQCNYQHYTSNENAQVSEPHVR